MIISGISKSVRALFVVVALGVGGSLLAGQAGKQAVLFDGKDLTGWRNPTGKWLVAKAVKVDEANPAKFIVEDRLGQDEGIMVNSKEGRTSNIVSQYEHGDVEGHIEFCVPKGSNSGVYFMGRYEIQVFDSWGVEKPKSSDCGGIYERWRDNKGYEGHAPATNASKAPGQWQSFDVVFRAPRFDASGKKTANAKFIKVVHNGQVIHENVEVTGPTRAATYENAPEKPQGPMMLQGDHGPVAYRNIKLTPVNLD